MPFEDYPLVQQAVENPSALFEAGQNVWVVGSGGSGSPDVQGVLEYLRQNAYLTIDTSLPGVTVYRFKVKS